jgi:hypothetical protein
MYGPQMRGSQGVEDVYVSIKYNTIHRSPSSRSIQNVGGVSRAVRVFIRRVGWQMVGMKDELRYF